MLHRKSEIHQPSTDPRNKVGSSEYVKIPFISGRFGILKELGLYIVRNANLGWKERFKLLTCTSVSLFRHSKLVT
jgi:hypothetical protein